MKYVVLIKPSGEITAEPVITNDFLTDLQMLVGGYIEIARNCSMLSIRQTLVIDEEGKLKGLAYNPVASTVFGAAVFGNAVIVKTKYDDIAAFYSLEYVNRSIINPLKYKLAQMLEAHDDE